MLGVAYREDRILVTLDKDFGELAIVYEQQHAGIIRLVGFGARQQAAICLEILAKYTAELQDRAIITVEPGRVRVRTQPSE